MSLMGNMFDAMNEWGFFDFLFPWLLVLAITYGILQTKQIISSEISVNGVISVVIAFFVAYMIKGEYLTNFLGVFSVMLLVVLAGLIMAGLAGVNVSDLNATWFKYGFLGIGLLAGIVAFLSSGGLGFISMDIDFSRIFNSEVFSVLLVLGIMIGAIYVIVKKSG